MAQFSITLPQPARVRVDQQVEREEDYTTGEIASRRLNYEASFEELNPNRTRQEAPESPKHFGPFAPRTDIDDEEKHIYKASFPPSSPLTSTAPRYIVAIPEADIFQGGLPRTLSQRHAQVISFACTIGTGLFLGSGSALQTGGPLGVLLAYAFVGTISYSVVCCLAELTAFLPVSGSFVHHSSRFVDPALGFAVGVNYWLMQSLTIPAQVSSAQLLIGYWNGATWLVPFTAAVCLIFIVLLNALPTRAYGESEAVFSAIKVLVAVVLILAGIAVDFGAGTGDVIGFRWWRDPGPLGEYLTDGATGRFLGILGCLLNAMFSFQGLEIASVAAAETRSPRRNVPRALFRCFWRVFAIYMISLLVVGMVVSSNDPGLASDGTALSSPFVIAVQRTGAIGFPSVINSGVLLSAISAAAAALFAGSRILQGLAARGQAPRIFARLNQNGQPVPALAITAAFGLLSFLNSSNGSGKILTWLINVSTSVGFWTWWTICLTTIRYVKAMRVQGLDRSTLVWHHRHLSFIAWYGLVSMSFVLLACGFSAFVGGFDHDVFLANYLDWPLFASLFVGYKLYYKTSLWRIAEIDLVTGNPSIEESEQPETPPKTRWHAIGRKLL